MPALLWLFVNATVNRHTHVTSDGRLIFHAHPYEKSPGGTATPEKHHHDNPELFFLSLISDPAIPLILVIYLLPVLDSRYLLLAIPLNYPQPSRDYYQVYHYHAPPRF
jgi:hypothetical protein